MTHRPSVQLMEQMVSARVFGMARDPLEQEEETTDRLSLDLPVSMVQFLERYAAYRNALNGLQKRAVKKWTRKSAAEAFLTSQYQQVLENMGASFDAHGPLPEDQDEMLAYARSVLAAAEKSTPKKR